MARLEVGDPVAPEYIDPAFAHERGVVHHETPGDFPDGATWVVYSENVCGRRDIHVRKSYPSRVAIAHHKGEFILVSKVRSGANYCFRAGPFPTFEAAQVAYLLEMM